MDLMASFKGLSSGTATNMLKLMRQAPAWALGLYLLHPQGAMAAEAQEIAQQAAAFPDYSQAFADTGFDVFQQLINVNKFTIEFIDYCLDSAFGSGDFGYSIIIYTLIVKALLYPLYYD